MKIAPLSSPSSPTAKTIFDRVRLLPSLDTLNSPIARGSRPAGCLHGLTRILTLEHGPIELDRLAGRQVTVIAGDGKLRQATINACGQQSVFRITFRPRVGGEAKVRQHVVATANHRWQFRCGMFSENLKVGHVIAGIPIDPNLRVDPVAVIHGLVYGDGSAHKGRRRHGRPGVSQGRTYASIRVCKQDSVRDEIHDWLDAGGYGYSTPPHADGDRVYYIGKFAHAKELPFSRDPEYIAGFIYGWWLADGSKTQNHSMEICTTVELGIGWLKENAPYIGRNITSERTIERKEGDGSFANGKPLHIVRLRERPQWSVLDIEPLGTATVYSVHEPVTTTFVLANGLLTG